jgi:hypothetical protein
MVMYGGNDGGGMMNGNFTEWISIGIGFWWKGTQINRI